MDCDCGVTVMLPTATGFTVSIAVPVLPSLVAVIVTLPEATPVATPEVESIVAMLGSLDVHTTARPVSTLPLASFVTAVNAGVLEPTSTDCVAGDTATVATGTGMTTMVAAPIFPSLDAVMVAEPAACDTTRPVLVTIATVSSLLAQLTARPE